MKGLPKETGEKKNYLMDPNVKVTLLLEVFKRHTGVHVLKVFFAIICFAN